ncbi:MAG: 50S ribosomal protein L29 [bacterium]|nr:50S ribosomal protein L29 [bacterium]
MKATATADLRKEKSEGLVKRVSELKRELMNLRFQKSSGQLEATGSFRVVRREIARIKTILTETNAKKAETK